MLSVGLRALVEGLRRQTLGRGAFQQIQLDVHYLRPEVRLLCACMQMQAGVTDVLQCRTAVVMCSSSRISRACPAAHPAA